MTARQLRRALTIVGDPYEPVISDDTRDETSWEDRALCAETDAEAFFPLKGQSSAPAKKVCRECPVKVECLEYALAAEIRDGVWGGLSERERRKLRRAAA